MVAARNTSTVVVDNLVITGFNAIEQWLKKSHKDCSCTLHYFTKNARVLSLVKLCESVGATSVYSTQKALDDLVHNLEGNAKEHRGAVLVVQGAKKQNHSIDLCQWLLSLGKDTEKNALVLMLDGITDPHNIGAILRSADGFGVNLVIMPLHNSVADASCNEVVLRSSAGSSVWVDICYVPNLTQCVKNLKEYGFWVYGADMTGADIDKTKFSNRACIVLGSEGSGIGRLLGKNCDVMVRIPTCGNIDSLNVSVAAGVILYEVKRQLSQ